MSLKLITSPTSGAITLAEAKLHLRVTHSAEDNLINGLIIAASELCQNETGILIMPQVWEKTLDNFPDAIELPVAPVNSIVTIKYIDTAGVEQTLSGASYTLDNASNTRSAWLVPASGYSWPSTYSGINGVKVRFNAGYADAASTPQALKQWMLLQIGHWFANRESVIVGATAIKSDYTDNLIKPYRLYSM